MDLVKDISEIIDISIIEYNKKKYGKALDILIENIINIEPNSSYYFYIALYCGMLGEYNKSIFFNKKALQYDKFNKSAINNLCCSYVCIGEYDIALKYSYYLLRIKPQDKNIENLISEILRMKDKYKK